MGRGYIVRTDNGHERFILDDGSRSPHLLWSDNQKQESVGYFRVEDR
jgi:hypothetical protein